MLLLEVLGGGAVVGIGRGDIQGGQEVGLGLGGSDELAGEECLGLVGSDELAGEECLEFGDEGGAALDVEAQGCADEHEGAEATVGRSVGKSDVTVVEQVVEGDGFVTVVTGVMGMLDAAVEDVDELRFDMVDEMFAEECLNGQGQMEVGGLVAGEREGLLAIEEGNAQGDADAGGGMLDVEDLGLGILEGAGGDDDGVVVFDVLDGWSEGEALLVLAAEGDEGLHDAVGHGDAAAGVTEVEMQVEASFEVPGLADEACELVGAALDEHEVAHGAPHVVGFLGVVLLFLEVLGVGVRDGLGEELVGDEILEEAQAFLAALLVLPLQEILYLFGVQV